MEENRLSVVGSSKKNSFSVALKNGQFQRSNNDRRKMSDNGFKSMGLSNISQKIQSSKREERERSER